MQKSNFFLCEQEKLKKETLLPTTLKIIKCLRRKIFKKFQG